MEINKGDFILGDEVWEVTEVYKEGLTQVYNIRSLTSEPKKIELWNWFTGMYEVAIVPNIMQGVTRGRLRHLGKFVPKEEAKGAVKVLFDNK